MIPFEKDAARLAGPDSTPPADVDEGAAARREAGFNAMLITAAASILRGDHPELADELADVYSGEDAEGATIALNTQSSAGRLMVRRRLESIRAKLERSRQDPISGPGWRAAQAIDLAILSLTLLTVFGARHQSDHE